MAYLAFARFNGTLSHDPTIGLSDDTSDGGTDPDIPGPSWQFVLLVAGVAVVFLARRQRWEF